MKVRYVAPALAVTLLASLPLRPALIGARDLGPDVREFTVVARRFAFDPARLEVNQGDLVRITITTADGTHGFTIKKLGVREPIHRGSGPIVVEFEAQVAGSFDISCSEYCGVGHNRMKGVLVVRPK